MRTYLGLLVLVVHFLLSACSFFDANDLVWSASEGNLPKVKSLVEGGIGVNTKAFDDGQTPLIAAVRSGRLKVIEFLLDSGADINLNDAGGTPLYWAAFSGQVDIYRFLLARGAKLKADDKSLSYLLRVMQEKGFVELIGLVQAQAQREANGV